MCEYEREKTQSLYYFFLDANMMNMRLCQLVLYFGMKKMSMGVYKMRNVGIGYIKIWSQNSSIFDSIQAISESFYLRFLRLISLVNRHIIY